MTAPRGLSAAEAEAWEKLAATVTPLGLRRGGAPEPAFAPVCSPPQRGGVGGGGSKPTALSRPHPTSPARGRSGVSPEAGGGLDGHWDRRFKSGAIEPDFTLDLHGHTLDSAHVRLDHGLAQAKAMGARVVLLIAGKPRPVDAADRASKRGAIRSKILDWLAAGPHGQDIAAIRNAHRKHGGAGALYLVLKRSR